MIFVVHASFTLTAAQLLFYKHPPNNLVVQLLLGKYNSHSASVYKLVGAVIHYLIVHALLNQIHSYKSIENVQAS